MQIKRATRFICQVREIKNLAGSRRSGVCLRVAATRSQAGRRSWRNVRSFSGCDSGWAVRSLALCTLHVRGWIIFGFRLLLRSWDNCSGAVGDPAKKKRPVSEEGGERERGVEQRRYLSAARDRTGGWSAGVGSGGRGHCSQQNWLTARWRIMGECEPLQPPLRQSPSDVNQG